MPASSTITPGTPSASSKLATAALLLPLLFFLLFMLPVPAA